MKRLMRSKDQLKQLGHLREKPRREAVMKMMTRTKMMR